MSSNIKTNERELASQIAIWFDEHIKRNNYPFNSASSEAGIKAEGKTYFGDIIVWNNRETKNACSYLELKPPFGNKENLDRFKKKAIELGVKIAYTWDFQTLNAYKIEGNKISLLDSEANAILIKIDDWLRGDVQAKIKSFIFKICDELLTVSKTERFTKFKPEKHYFVQFIRDTVATLIPLFEDFIKKEYRKRENKDKINKYVVEQGITYPSDDAFFKLIASQRVYGLVTKIIFYLTIRRYFSDLPALLQEAEPDVNQNLNTAFGKAAEKDWQAVFVGGPIADLGIPQNAFSPLQELFANLEIYHFGELPEDVIGELFEEIIDPEQRHLLGQYFTREDLVDFVISTIVNDSQKYYADPTCGSGTFLIRLYSRLKFLEPRLKHEQILEKIWGIDIGKFPSELATINLFRQDVSNFENFPRILNRDIFDVVKGSSFEFPPPFAGKNYVKINIPLPQFGGLVGNFPFIRQELIEKKVPGVKLKLTKLLAGEFLHTYPDLFELDKKVTQDSLLQLEKEDPAIRTQRIGRLVDKKLINLTLSGQADIYSYIFLHTTTLLSDDGAVAVITSNSWLDVSYGSVIKQFLLSHFKIKMIVASWAEPWFEDAAVNTVFTVLEKEPDDLKRQNNAVKFVKLKKKLKELVPEPVLQTFNNARWQKFDALIRKIEQSEYKSSPVVEGIQSFEDGDLRVRLVQQNQLAFELAQNNKLSKWGKYLRAPDVYFEIIEKCKDKLVPLKEIAEVRFGIKTGVNEFFYLQKIEKDNKVIAYKNARGWQGEIEPDYLREVIKSPKEADSITINPSKLKNLLFVCNKSKSELKKLGHRRALAYIEWGEKQRDESNILWTEVPSVQGRKDWYRLDDKMPGPILLQMINNNRFNSFYNKTRVFVDHNLFEFLLQDEKLESGYLAFMNSTLFALIKEVNSRINLGDGATKTEGVDWNNLILAPRKEAIEKLIFSDNKFFDRPSLPIDEEVKKKDRIALDKIVLESLQLEDSFLDRIYKGITELVDDRLNLPKMRKKQQKQKIKISYDQVRASVIKECIGEAVKIFPDSFYTKGNFEALEFDVYNTSGLSVRIEHFMGRHDVKDEKGQVLFVTDNEAKALFAKQTAKPGNYVIKIPKKEEDVASILAAYQSYYKDLKNRLETNAQQKLHSWNEAEKMASEILLEYGFQKLS